MDSTKSLVKLYEALLKSGHFKDKPDLLSFINSKLDIIRILLKENK